MDISAFKNELGSIEMPEEMKNRIISNCRARCAAESEEKTMKRFTFKRPAVAIVALALCLCFAVGAGAAISGGSFKDITDWSGAVTGTEYINASDEIIVDAKAENGVLSISAVFEKADEIPYSAIEELGIVAYTITDKAGEEPGKATYTITDKHGSVLKEGEMEMVPIENGCAEFAVSLSEFSKGEYVLEIDSFVGGAKAEQPLPIKGSWIVEFAV